MHPIKTEKNRHFFYGLFILVTLAMIWLTWEYLSTVFLSVLTVIIFRPLYLKVLKGFKGRVILATFATIAIIFLIVLLPLTGVVILTITQVAAIIEEVSQFFRSSNFSLETLVDTGNSIISSVPFVQIDYRFTENQIIEFINNLVQPVSQFIIAQTSNVLAIGGRYSLAFIAHLFIFIYILAALFPTFPNFLKFIKKLSPLDDRIDDIYISRVMAMIEAMVKGIFIIAIIQGLLSGIFYWIAGVPYVLFWVVLATFLSIIPVGSGFVTIPLGFAQILSGNIWQGVMLILAYVLFISLIDNVLRPKLAPKEAQLSEALILVSLLGGLASIGFLGIIYGPVILILFYTTIEMYIKYYRIDKPKPEDRHGAKTVQKIGGS
jgi:predicted PurR-regulated permease PerM